MGARHLLQPPAGSVKRVVEYFRDLFVQNFKRSLSGYCTNQGIRTGKQIHGPAEKKFHYKKNGQRLRRGPLCNAELFEQNIKKNNWVHCQPSYTTANYPG